MARWPWLLRDVKTFVSSRDLIVFGAAIALSNQLQTTLNTLIESLVMPLVSRVTGQQKLKDRALVLGRTGVAIKWGAALNAVVTFSIALVVTVQIAKLLTTKVFGSGSIQW